MKSSVYARISISFIVPLYKTYSFHFIIFYWYRRYTSNSVYTIHPEFNLFQFSCQLWCHFYTKIYRFQNMILFSFSILTLHFNVKSQPHWQCKQMPRISEILCVQHFYSFSHLCTSHFCLQSISQPETNAKAENKKKFSLHLLIDFLISASSLFTLQFVTSLKALDKQP